jgi:serine/threonine-protein kinase RsbT
MDSAQVEVPLLSEQDVVVARQLVRKKAQESGMSLVDQTKLVTAASELARNTVIYGGGGKMTLESLVNSGRRGLRLAFKDQGPGIPNLDLALKDGWTSGNGLGMGLSGSRRLVNEFDLVTKVGEGTCVTIAHWK